MKLLNVKIQKMLKIQRLQMLEIKGKRKNVDLFHDGKLKGMVYQMKIMMTMMITNIHFNGIKFIKI